MTDQEAIMRASEGAVCRKAVAPWRNWLSYVLAVIAIAAALTVVFCPGRQVRIPLESEKILPELPGSFAYVYPLERNAEVGDDEVSGTRSDLVLLEDGKPLFQAHASIDAFRTVGKGQYCHWQRNLFFSSSDNTDPRTNGRRYEAIAFLYPRTVYYLGFGFLAASLAILAVVSQWLFLRVYYLAPPLFGLIGSAVFLAVTCLGWFRGIVPALTAVFEILPCQRQLLRLEAMVPALLLGWAVGGALIGWIAWLGRRWIPLRPARQEELRLTRLLRRFGLLLTISVFLLTLAARWSGPTKLTPRNDVTLYSALLGHVPWSDAASYYWGAQEAADTGTMNYWNERRPVNACLFSLRLAVSGLDLDVAMLMQVVLAAIAVYFAAWSLGQRLGVWSGVGCLAFLLGYIRLYLVTTLSETLGLTLGSLALGLLLQASFRRSWLLCATGLLALALAMSARAGALFVLPCLLVWVLLSFRGSWRLRATALAAGCLALAMGMSSSFILDRTYGVGESSAGANLAHTLCGLSCGTSWSGAMDIYADELKNMPDEREQARFLYAKAWERIQADPSVFLHSLWQGETSFLSQYPAFLKETIASRVVSGSHLAQSFEPFVFISLTCGCLAWLWRRRFQDDFWLVAATAGGVLLSVPIIFLDGGWRVLAASWPLIIVPLAAGLAVPGRRTPWQTKTTDWHCRAATGLLVALIVGIAFGPMIARHIARRPATLEAAAADPNRLVIRSWPGFAAVAVVDEGQPRAVGIPTITRRQFIEDIFLSNMGDDNSLILPEPPPTPFLVLLVYDVATKKVFHLLAPLALKDQTSPFLELHVKPWRASNYFREVVDFHPVP